MKKSVVLSIPLWLLLFPAAGHAQIEDYEFAQGLADRSYFALAEEVLNDMISRPGISPVEKTSAELGLVGVLKRSADKEASGPEKLDKYRNAAKGYEEFIGEPSNEDHPKFFDALFEFGELLQSKGEAIGKMMESEQNPDRITELRSEGTEAIKEAQGLLQRAADYLSSLPEDQRDAKLYQKALFYRALNYYYVANLQASGSFEKENNLKEAADQLEEFVWEYEGFPAAWLALLYVGKSYGERALENESRSEEFASLAIDYLEGIVAIAAQESTKPRVINDPWFMGLVQRAIFEEAVVHNAMSRYPEAIDTVKRLDTILKGVEDAPDIPLGTWGFLAQLERVKALEKLQDMESAIKLCQEMAKEADGSVGRLLARKLAELIDSGPTVEITIPADVLFTTAQGFYGQKNWFRAIDYFQQSLAAIEKTGEQKELAPEIWNYIGRGYRKLNDNLAAAIAYETGAKLKGFDTKDEMVESNAFAAYGAYAAQSKLEARGKGVSDFVRKAHLDLREYLTKEYPGTDLVYYAGKDELEAGNYEAAAIELAKVEKKSELLYPRAQAKLAETYFEIGKKMIEAANGSITTEARTELLRIDSLASNFDRFTEDPNWQTGDVQAQGEREQARAALDYYRAKSKQLVGKTDEAIAILDEYPTKYESQPNFVEAALYLMVEVQIETNRLAAAEETIKRLDELFPESRATAAGYLQIGQAYKGQFNKALEQYAQSKGVEDPDDAAEEFLADSEQESARAALTKSSDFVKIWWDKQGRPFGKGLEIGNDFFRTGEYDKALEVLEAIYARDKDNSKVSARQRRALKFLLAETYLWHKKYTEAEPIYAELYEQYIGDKTGVVNVELRKNYAMTLGGTAVLEGTNEVVEYDGVEKYKEAKEMWTPIAKSRELRFGDEYWLAQFHIAYLDYKLGNTDAAKGLIDNLLALYETDLKNDPSGPLFNWLQRKLR